MNIPPASRPTSPLSSKPAGRIIRVLTVDDSPLVHQALAAILKDVPDIEVVGKASNGQEAIRLLARLKPDVIIMDVRMPKMDGVDATRHIMRIRPTPIVILAAGYSGEHNIAFNAIEAGALTVVEKPRGMGMGETNVIRSQLVTAIRAMADVKVASFYQRMAAQDGVGPMTAMLQAYFTRPIQVVAIASSTGGPPVLMKLFSSLPTDFSIPIIVVQHVLPQFTSGLVDWLGTKSNLKVRLAEKGARLAPGTIWIAPGNAHLMIRPGGIIHLDESPPVKGHRPSATPMFYSVAQAFRANSVGIILSGMGDDGVDGLETLSNVGAHVIAQNEDTSVVYSMPKVAVQRDIVDEVLSPDEMVMRLLKLHRQMQALAGGD